MNTQIKLSLFFVLVALLFQNCSDNTTNPDQSAKVQVKLIDLPGDYLEVNVNIIDVRYKISNDENEEDVEWTSFDSFEGPQVVNLKELTGGVSLILADEVLPAGYLNQIRLVLDEDENTIVVEGETEGVGTSYPLETPSAQQSGLKIKIDEELEGGFSYNIVLDWDVQKSIVDTGSGKYQLKPVIRAELEKNSGIISGYVYGDLPDDADDNPVGLENVVVELFSADQELSEEPLTTTTTDEVGRYSLEGLKPGAYIIVIEREGFDHYISTEITVRVGEVTDNATITLTPSA